MNVRVSVPFSLLLLLGFATAYADGTYQWTEGRHKALVWNNNPKPGDAATWSGDQDAEGYATGEGTLSWFRVERKFLTGSNLISRKETPISRYSGTMSRGKFNGVVETVDHGKTYHAMFAGGHTKGRWLPGPAPAEVAAAKPTELVKEQAEPAAHGTVFEEQPTATAGENPERSTSNLQSPVTEQTTRERSEPSLGEEQGSVEAEKSQSASSKPHPSTPLIAHASTEEPEESISPREPVTKRAALAPGAVRPIEQPARHAAAKTAVAEPIKKTKETNFSEEKAEKRIAEKPEPIAAETEPPAEGPDPANAGQSESSSSKSQTSEPTESSTRKPELSSKQAPADDSIRALTGPPSSLHPDATAPNAAPKASASAGSPEPNAAPKLNAAQAMDLADMKAQVEGYDLGEYELPRAEYNAADGTWLVTYIGRDSSGGRKRLTLTVEDRTKKAKVKN